MGGQLQGVIVLDSGADTWSSPVDIYGLRLERCHPQVFGTPPLQVLWWQLIRLCSSIAQNTVMYGSNFCMVDRTQLW